MSFIILNTYKLKIMPFFSPRDYEEVTLDGGATTLNRYECTLLPKDQKVFNISDNVPKSAPNEGSMKGTSSKDNARNSTSNDGCAPPLEKVYFE
jgi:hypothetical protein